MNRCKVSAAEEPGAEAMEILAAAGDVVEKRALKPAEPPHRALGAHSAAKTDATTSAEMPKLVVIA
jgi:hypothetical protein